MVSQTGFNSVMSHPETIKQMGLCLSNVDPQKCTSDEQRNKVYRTHVLVLELLAAVCLVPKGHPRVLEAFDNYKEVSIGFNFRFETF